MGNDMIKGTLALVYPYNISFAALLRQLCKQDIYSIVSAVAVGNWFKEGIDASFFDEGPSIGVPLKQNLMNEIVSVDTVIWANQDYSNNPELFNFIKESIKKVLQKSKNVVCCQPLSAEDRIIYEHYAATHGCKFKYVLSETGDVPSPYRSLNYPAIDVPIIAVAGIYNHCQVMDVVSYLSNSLQADNCKISVIAPSQCASIVGYHAFPDFMLLGGLCEIEKIFKFRETILTIQNTEKPDAIIVGIPNNLLMFNDKYPGDYGMSAYEVFSSITPDVSIVCVDCDTYSLDFEERLRHLMRYRYNVDIDAICISNIAVNRDSLELDLYNAPEYNIFSLADVMRKVKTNVDFCVYPIIDEHSMYMLKQKILGLLT